METENIVQDQNWVAPKWSVENAIIPLRSIILHAMGKVEIAISYAVRTKKIFF